MSEKCIRGWDESISGSKTMWKRELSFRRRRVGDRSKRTSIYHSTGLLGRCCLVGAFLSIVSSVSVAQDNSAVGQWSPVMTWPYKAIHAHLLPTGNVLFWPKADQAQLWNPATNSITAAATAGANIFCSGHSFLPDGRLLVGGGHVVNYVGLPNAYIYDPLANAWTRLPDMNNGRWYPTNTTLPNGDVLVIAGQVDTTQGMNPEPQVWQSATGNWRDLSSAQLILPYYPFMYVAPNGKVFMAGPNSATRYLDVSSTGAWTTVANNLYGNRHWASSAMYDDGKIIVMGGATCGFYSTCTTLPTATAEIINLNTAQPAWTYTGSMALGRRLHNATLLADGKVLVTGGTQGTEGPNTNSTNPAYAAELWDPATGTWSTMASQAVFRGYHSVALLLPDGRVLSAGGETVAASAEIYSPPYLFWGPRPTISSAPNFVNYGDSFFVATPDANDITNVNLIALSSVTHGFNMNQRISRPSFSPTAGGLNAMAPANPNNAPPGYYMLFILNGSGVPSIAKIIQIGSAAGPSPTPSPSSTPTPTPTPTPTATPVAPSNLTGTAVSASSINLSWTDNSGDETGFTIQRSTDGTSFGDVATVGANVTTFSDTGLVTSTTYSYRVSAFNSGGSSAYSNIATIALIVPAAPSNLAAKVEKNGQVTLSWKDNANNETGFQAERSTDGSVFTVLATTAANTTKYKDTKAQKGQTYYYRVAAKNNVGLSSYSNVATTP